MSLIALGMTRGLCGDAEKNVRDNVSFVDDKFRCRWGLGLIMG